MKELTVNGVTYTSTTRAGGQVCTGCVARFDEKLCEQVFSLCDGWGKTVVTELDSEIKKGSHK